MSMPIFLFQKIAFHANCLLWKISIDISCKLSKGDSLHEMSMLTFFSKKLALTFHANCLHVMSMLIFFEKSQFAICWIIPKVVRITKAVFFQSREHHIFLSICLAVFLLLIPCLSAPKKSQFQGYPVLTCTDWLLTLVYSSSSVWDHTAVFLQGDSDKHPGSALFLESRSYQ